MRVKFYVVKKEEFLVGGSGLPDTLGYTVELNPVIEGSAENKMFYKYTPAGKITLSTINQKGAGELEVGKQYYVDFTVAE